MSLACQVTTPDTNLINNMCSFAVGDRVKGLYGHKGKVGTVIEAKKMIGYVCVKWDNGKRKGYVDCPRLELIKK